MKKLLTIIILIVVGSFLLTSCSNNVLNQFSKRKYLKHFKSTKLKTKDTKSISDYRKKEVGKLLLASNNNQLKNYIYRETPISKDNELKVLKKQYEKGKSDTKIKIEPRFKRKLIKSKFLVSSDEDIKPVKEVHPLAKTSAFLMLFFIPAAFVVSIIALNKIKKNPEKYKGKGLALAVLISSGLIILLMIAFIAFVSCFITLSVGGTFI